MCLGYSVNLYEKNIMETIRHHTIVAAVRLAKRGVLRTLQFNFTMDFTDKTFDKFMAQIIIYLTSGNR